MVIIRHGNVILVELSVDVRISSDRQRCVRLYVAVNRDCRFLTGRNCVDREFRTCINIAARENVRLISLVRHRVDDDPASSAELPFLSLRSAPLNALSDRKKYMAAWHHDGLLFIILRVKTPVLIVHGDAFFENDARRPFL